MAWTIEERREYYRNYYADNKDKLHGKYEDKFQEFKASHKTWHKLRFFDLLEVALEIYHENENLCKEIQRVKHDNIILNTKLSLHSN